MQDNGKDRDIKWDQTIEELIASSVGYGMEMAMVTLRQELATHYPLAGHRLDQEMRKIDAMMKHDADTPGIRLARLTSALGQLLESI